MADLCAGVRTETRDQPRRVNDLKDVERVLKLCRKHGVLQVSIDGLEAKFAESTQRGEAQEQNEVPTDEPTEDELINWSVPRIE